MSRTRALALALWFASVATSAAAEVSLHGRAEVVASGARLPPRDLRAPDDGRYRADQMLDLRAQWKWEEQRDAQQTDTAWRVEADVQLLADYGSSLRTHRSASIVQTGVIDGDTDEPRAFDLARSVARSGAHRLRMRFDRLLIGFRGDAFAFSMGRQAISWGNGLVFAPMDLLSPFAPGSIDRDFKSGDDLALAQWQFENEGDLQVVAVARRSAGGKRAASGGSVGVHWQQPLWDAELTLLAARHAEDDVFGIGISMPIADAVLRADWVVTALDAGGQRTSLLLNADRSFVVAERNLYAFAEIYRNGFGQGETPRSLSRLRSDLRTRLARGEVFTTARWYAAVGTSIEWHSLLRQQSLAIASLQDGSVSLQTSLRYEPDDRARLDATLGWSGGSRGDEFAGLAIAEPAESAPTIGGGWRGEIRYALYW